MVSLKFGDGSRRIQECQELHGTETPQTDWELEAKLKKRWGRSALGGGLSAVPSGAGPALLEIRNMQRASRLGGLQTSPRSGDTETHAASCSHDALTQTVHGTGMWMPHVLFPSQST